MADVNKVYKLITEEIAAINPHKDTHALAYECGFLRGVLARILADHPELISNFKHTISVNKLTKKK